MIGMHQVKWENFDYSNVNSHHGRRSARSQHMRWSTFSLSSGRKDMLPWITGCQLMLQTKKMLEGSLTTWKIPWMMRYLPSVRVYVLEDIKKREDEVINALVDCICQIAHCALIGDVSDAAVEFKVQLRWIHAILECDIELQKELLKVSCDKDVSHLLEICHKYCAIEYGATAIWTGKTINAVQKSFQPWKLPQKQCLQCQSCTCQHPPGCDICQAWESVSIGYSKKRSLAGQVSFQQEQPICHSSQ